VRDDPEDQKRRIEKRAETQATRDEAGRVEPLTPTVILR
jgi:hypothetical protein